MTKEALEAGITFVFQKRSYISPALFLMPGQKESIPLYRKDLGVCYCFIRKITRSGFYFYSNFFGRQVKGKIPFRQCIQLET